MNILSQKIKKIVGCSIFLILCFGIFSLKYMLDKQQALYPLPTGYEHGIWEWRGPTPNSLRALPKLAEYQFKTVYLSMGEMLDISELTAGKDQEKKQQDFFKNTEEYLKIAKQNNLRVEAVFGGPTWNETTHQYLIEKSIKNIAVYNQQHADNPFSGIQFDIEPYNKVQFENNKDVEVGSYLNTIRKIVEKNKEIFGSSTLRVGIVIPFWFDGENQYISKINWNNEVKFPFNHLVHELNGLPDSYITVMAYRNNTEGADGSIAHAAQEIKFTSTYAPRVKILVAQEVGNHLPRKITFYGGTRKKFNVALTTLVEYFENFKTFKGVAINDVENYLLLEEGK